MTPQFPHRKSPRAQFHDYSGGEYFITICTRDKEHYFGMIRDCKMILTKIGEVCDETIRNLHQYYPYAEVLHYVVMPNHVHLIIKISDGKDKQDSDDKPDAPLCVPTKRTALSVVAGGLKQTVTMYARRNNITFGWQPRYHDHIIRGYIDGNRIWEYISNNVAQWDTDCFHTNNENP